MATPELKPQTTETPEARETNPLAEVIEEVRADAQRDPKAYARETIVAEGGE